MKKRKLTPADYGQFYFRVSHEDKPELEAEIQLVLEMLKQRHQDGELQPKRNELILRALRRGLKSISRELKDQK